MNGRDTLYYLDSLQSGEFAIFYGAGISKNSGLPLANELKTSILEKLSIDRKDIDEIMMSNLPFEAFIETIPVDISKVLDIFKEGEPNVNHILIARLAKNGYIRTIFTTNFDLLIEKALEKEGLKENVDFKRYYDEEQFSRIDFNEVDDKIAIFKIHGSADDETSIRTTLRAVASKTLSDKRMNVIRYLFSTGKHKKVLVLGYSCSDEFDITPQIQSVEENKKEVIFVEHCKEGKEIEDVKVKEYKNPFKKFTGKRIKCNTNDFIKDLWNSLDKIVGEYKYIKSKVYWKTYVDDWVMGLNGDQLKYYIVGLIFYQITDFKKAIQYYDKALEIVKSLGEEDEVKEAICYLYIELGKAYFGKGNPRGNIKKAIQYNEKALGFFKAIGGKVNEEASCYNSLGDIYSGIGNFKRAIQYHEKALEIAGTIEDKVLVETSYYESLGTAYNVSRDFKRAIQYHEKALEIANARGDKVLEASCYGGLGYAFLRLRNFKKSVLYYEKALEISKLIGDEADEVVCSMGLGYAHRGLRDFKKGIDYLLKAKKISEKRREIPLIIEIKVSIISTLVFEKIWRLLRILKITKGKKKAI